jgi:hypothetical protein
VSPGYLDWFHDRTRLARCNLCDGVDLLSLGFIHHKPDCPRSPCVFCGLVIMPTERRTIHNGRTAHLDCAVDFEHDRDKEDR